MRNPLPSRRAIHFDDVSIRIEQKGLREPRKTIAVDDQPPGIAFNGILAETLCGQAADHHLEIFRSKSEMRIGAIDGRRLSEATVRVDDDVELQRPTSEPGARKRERR